MKEDATALLRERNRGVRRPFLGGELEFICYAVIFVYTIYTVLLKNGNFVYQEKNSPCEYLVPFPLTLI